MKKCSLCGRKISNKEYSFGLGCLKKAGGFIGIEGIKNQKAENILNIKIQEINKKTFLSQKQKQLLTDRYLAYQMLYQVEIPYYQTLAQEVEEEIKNIDKNTRNSNNKNSISLKEAFEIFKLYERYRQIFDKTQNYTDEELKNEIQNLPWDTIMFAFSKHYEKKPYLSELIQVVQLFIWKIGAKIASPKFECGAEFLKHSLQEKPEDLYITEGKIVEKIKNDINFINKINEILEKHKNDICFDTQNKEFLNYKDIDLFMALNNTRNKSCWK